MSEIDVLKAQLVRKDLSTPWGFRLQGGADQGEPVTILRITPASPAARIGLKAGDEITEVGDVPTENLTYNQVLDIISQYGDTIVLTVERRARGSIPVNPVISTSDDVDRPKLYQTYDMTGGKPHLRPENPTYIPAAQIDQNMPQSPVFAPQTMPAMPKPETREAAKAYQTYDMNGPRAAPPVGPQHDYQFHTVTAKPFMDQPRHQTYHSPPPSQPQPQPQQQPQEATYTSAPAEPSYQPQAYSSGPPEPSYQPQSFSPQPPEPSYQPQPRPQYPQETPAYYPDETEDPDVQQSRTFKTLASLMQNEEPAAGVMGLPPPRSMSQEIWKQEQARRSQPGASPRVKVFMPQQYNSPLGMYSAKNVVETFQAQAETMMESMERKQYDDENQPVSSVHRAVVGN